MMRAKIAAVAVASLALVGMSSGQASAHNIWAHHGADTGHASNGYKAKKGAPQEHRQITVQDNECDHHKVQVSYHVEGVKGAYHVRDHDGCGGSAWTVNWNTKPGGRAITNFKVCELFGKRWGCSPTVIVHDDLWMTL